MTSYLSKQFLKSQAQTAYADAKAVIIPIPYKATTTYHEHGMELAPLLDSVVSDFSTVKLVYKLIGYKSLSLHSPRVG